MKPVITSTKIKAGLFNYFRSKKQFDCCATECGDFYADFLAVNKKNELIEIEVKISIQDLKADFEKPKHIHYKGTDKNFIPRYFYYCVPEKLVNECRQLLNAKGFDKYGIFMFKEDNGFRHLIDSIYQVYRATELNNFTVNEYEAKEIMRRMTSDLQGKHNMLATITPSKKMAKDNKALKNTLKMAERIIDKYEWCNDKKKKGCEDCIFKGNCCMDKEIEQLTKWFKEGLSKIKD